MNVRDVFFAACLTLGAFFMAGCQEEGPAERTGEVIDEAVDDVRDAAEEAAEDVEDAAEDLSEKLDNPS